MFQYTQENYRFAERNPPIFKDIFNKRTLNYELWLPSQFKIPRVESVYNGFESIACLEPTMWNMVQSELKEMWSLSSFNKAINDAKQRNDTLVTIRVDY